MESNLVTTIQTYDATADAYAARTLAIDTSKQINRFLTRIPRGGLILDAGCGPGRDTKIFVDKGYAVVGVDLSAGLLRIARQQSPGSVFLQMDLRKTVFPDNSFAGIWAMSSLMHLEKSELPAALAESYRLLRSGGPMYMSLKFGAGEGLELDPRAGGNKYYSYYTDSEAKDLVEAAGFKLDELVMAATIDQAYATKPWMDIYLKKE